METTMREYLTSASRFGGRVKIDGVNYITMVPPSSVSLSLPAVRQAVRAFVARQITRAQVQLLRQHWMLLEI